MTRQETLFIQVKTRKLVAHNVTSEVLVIVDRSMLINPLIRRPSGSQIRNRHWAETAPQQDVYNLICVDPTGAAYTIVKVER